MFQTMPKEWVQTWPLLLEVVALSAITQPLAYNIFVFQEGALPRPQITNVVLDLPSYRITS